MALEPVAVIVRGPDGEIRLPPDALTERAVDGGRRFDWASPAASPVDSVSVLFAPGPPAGSRYFRNGYQSWSFAGPDDANGPVARTALDVVSDAHHSVRTPPTEVHGESSQFLAAEGLLVGFAACQRANGTVYLTPEGIEAHLDLKRGAFAEGDPLESVFVYEADDVGASMDAFLDASAALGSARAGAPHMAGWCTWYQYFDSISEEAFDANLAEAASKFEGGFDLFQLDDGYQRAIGDWLETNEKFPSGIRPIATRIDDAGMIPGIWYAPFIVYPDSSNYDEALLARQDDGSPMPAIVNMTWGGKGIGYALDTTNPDSVALIEETARGLVESGFRYLKLDFTFAAAMDAERVSAATKAEAMHLGLDAVRRGAGDDTYLLGCGMPLWPAIGTVDAMRIGQDVAPHWEPEMQIPGLTESFPATRSAYGNTLARARMHRRLWVNDPDCVMLRRSETGLTDEQVDAWADLVADSGELLLLSDDLSLIDDPGEWRALVDRSRAADGFPPWAPGDPLEIRAY